MPGELNSPELQQRLNELLAWLSVEWFAVEKLEYVLDSHIAAGTMHGPEARELLGDRDATASRTANEFEPRYQEIAYSARVLRWHHHLHWWNDYPWALTDKEFREMQEDEEVLSTGALVPAYLYADPYREYKGDYVKEVKASLGDAWGQEHNPRPRPEVIASFKSMHGLSDTIMQRAPTLDELFQMGDYLTAKDEAGEYSHFPWLYQSERLELITFVNDLVQRILHPDGEASEAVGATQGMSSEGLSVSFSGGMGSFGYGVGTPHFTFAGTPTQSFMDLEKDLRDMFSGNQAATEDLTGSVAGATEAHDSWMTQLVEGRWVTDEVTGEIVGHTGATEEATATVGNAALTLETQVDPALSNAALLHALTQAEVLDTEGTYRELSEESMAAAVEGIRDTGKMPAALGISGAEMDGVVQSLIGQYGSLEAAFVAAAMSSQSGPSSSPSNGPDPESGDPETAAEEPEKTLEQIVKDVFVTEDAPTQAWIVQNMGAVIETGDNAGKTFQELADNEAYKEAHGGQNMPGFALGGIVPGPVGAPIWAMVHGGERILRSSEAAGDVTINLNVENRNMSEADLLRTVRSGLLRMDRRVVGVLGQRAQ